MTFVFFVYGLAFFALALALTVRSVPVDLMALRIPLFYLAGFGFIHATAEWTVMAQLIIGGEAGMALNRVAITLGGISFIVLFLSAYHLPLDTRKGTRLVFGGYLAVASILWAVLAFGAWGGAEWFAETDVVGRWLIGAPSAFLLGIGLIMIGRKSPRFVSRSREWEKLVALKDRNVFTALQIAGAALIGYGISTFFGARLDFFPLNNVNADQFLDTFGVPVPLFRTLLTIILTAAILAFIQRFVGIERQQLETQIDLRTVEFKNLSDDLLIALNEAEAATSAKSDFLAGMSHELRTPLNAVLGFAQMMQHDPQNRVSSAQQEYLENILNAGTHLLNLINEILDLAEIEAGHLDLFVEEVKANEIVAGCANLLGPLAKQRNIQILDEFSAGPTRRFLTDKKRLHQVLVNLLSNAIKYNKAGGIVTVDGQETEDGILRINVTDTGVGIAEKNRPYVFESFCRLASDPGISREGTGIGLALSKLLVLRMAGRIGFESEENVGSRFWVEFPTVSNEEYLLWTETMRTGIEKIDDDHGYLVSLLNRLSEDGVDFDQTIDDLKAYFHDHFRREELVMRICEFPELEDHRQIHRDIELKIDELAAEWRKTRDPGLLSEFQKLLRDWFFNHIINTDSKIAPYAKKSRVKSKKPWRLDLGRVFAADTSELANRRWPSPGKLADDGLYRVRIPCSNTEL